MNKGNWKYVLELCCRLYVFIFLNVYGWAKLFGGQFYTPDNMPNTVLQSTIAEVSNFDLAWSFMGRSFGYLLFIGLSEIIGAWLLLFNRTKLLGACILLVVLVNVIVFDIFFLDAYGALASAILYSLLLLTILWLNRSIIQKVFKTITAKTNILHEGTSKPLLLVLSLLLMILLFGLDQFVVNLLGHGKG